MRSINFTSIDWRMKIFLIKEKEKSLKSMHVKFLLDFIY